MRAGDDAHGGIEGQEGRAAVAEKGQGQADDRQDEKAHAHVGEHLEDQRPGDAHADIGGQKGVLA